MLKVFKVIFMVKVSFKNNGSGPVSESFLLSYLPPLFPGPLRHTPYFLIHKYTKAYSHTYNKSIISEFVSNTSITCITLVMLLVYTTYLTSHAFSKITRFSEIKAMAIQDEGM